MKSFEFVISAICLVVTCRCKCPHLQNQHNGNVLTNNLAVENSDLLEYSHTHRILSESIKDDKTIVDFKSVKFDILQLFTDSKSFWPADFGHYGPLFIRLAWHCAGTYRQYDGRGGCDGARQRFEPERSWDDNTNLDKAYDLLWPIKEKYGQKLSWGDLVILTGTTAIEAMGLGRDIGFCGGRIDDSNGRDSLELGPSMEQTKYFPCDVNGNCSKPLGSTTIGLIYVNPSGPMNRPIPSLSAVEIREVFHRMTMNDQETVALIGGGHSFGKMHGACPTGPGTPPNKTPDGELPWQGTCKNNADESDVGVGRNTFTSGFEGQWTSTPTKWSNEYFNNLLNYHWKLTTSPANNSLWRRVIHDSTATDKSLRLERNMRESVSKSFGSKDTNNNNNDILLKKEGTNKHKIYDTNFKFLENDPIRMLTTDVALINDPSNEYQKWVSHYSTNLTAFQHDFAHAWYKLVTRDMGPVTRCVGPFVPSARDFQYPLPPPLFQYPDSYSSTKLDVTESLSSSVLGNSDSDKSVKDSNTKITRLEVNNVEKLNWSNVYQAIENILYVHQKSTSIAGDLINTTHYYYGNMFIQLAYSCAITFRRTDYIGGCNGARIRFSPEIDEYVNVGLKEVLQVLEPIKQQFIDSVTWADLIVLAAQVAIEHSTNGMIKLPFCPGRSDAMDGTASKHLSPHLSYNTTLRDMEMSWSISGLTSYELIVLQGRPRSVSLMLAAGYSGSYLTSDTLYDGDKGLTYSKSIHTKLSNNYFSTLMDNHVNRNWKKICQLRTNSKLITCEYSAIVKSDDGDNNNPNTIYATPFDMNLVYKDTFRTIVENFASNNTKFLHTFASSWTKLMSIDRFDGPSRTVCPVYGDKDGINYFSSQSQGNEVGAHVINNNKYENYFKFFSHVIVTIILVISALVVLKMVLLPFISYRFNHNNIDIFAKRREYYQKSIFNSINDNDMNKTNPNDSLSEHNNSSSNVFETQSLLPH